MDTRRLYGIAASLILAAAMLPGTVAAAGRTSETAQPATQARPAACTPGHKACPIAITFAPGAYSGQASSRLGGINARRWFSFQARKNQTMIVIVAGAGPTRGTVFFPNGGSSGQPGGRVYDGRTHGTGTYKVKVTESLMGEAWSGPVDVVVVIY
jgi:hypothetical protein